MYLNFTDIAKLAEKLAKIIRKGDLIALYGELGAGKTTFVKTFVRELGIDNRVTSPTFTFVNRYSSDNLTVYHLDAYRISKSSELDSIGFNDLINPNSILIIEWANLIEDRLPQQYIKITFSYAAELLDGRNVEIDYVGDEKRRKEILNCTF